MQPVLVMLAGPNGAGKTTFYEAHLSGLGLPFLNADRLVDLTGIDGYDAADQIAIMRERFVAEGRSFISETVFSDPVGAKVAFLKSAVAAGFDVRLLFIGISGPELSRKRVAGRVEAGGHGVPEEKLEARYPRTLENLRLAIKQLPDVRIYDNSSYRDPFRLLATFERGRLIARGKGRLPAWVGGGFGATLWF